MNRVLRFLKVEWKKGSWILLFLFIIPFIADMISTFRAGELVEHLEANPVYKLGGVWVIILLNFFALWFLLKTYNNKFMANRFSAVVIVVWLFALRCFVVWQNWQIGTEYLSGELTVVEASQVTQEAKNIYLLWLTLAFVTPVFLTNFCFWIFRIDHKVVDK